MDEDFVYIVDSNTPSITYQVEKDEFMQKYSDVAILNPKTGKGVIYDPQD